MTQEWSFRFSLFGAVGSCFVIFLSSEAAGQEHSHGHGQASPEFSEACLPAMPNTFRPVSPDDVKRYWVSQLPTVFPPSRSSSGYAHDVPMYRARLEARTCLVQKIQGGFLDDRAAMEMLRHNIRYYQNRGDRDRVEELELELLRREAICQGNLGAVVRLEELKRDEGTNLEELVRRQAQVIEELLREFAAMKRQMNQP